MIAGYELGVGDLIVYHCNNGGKRVGYISSITNNEIRIYWIVLHTYSIISQPEAVINFIKNGVYSHIKKK